MQLDIFEFINPARVSFLTESQLLSFLEGDMRTMSGQAESVVNSLREYLAASHAFTIYAFSGAGKYRRPEAASMFSILKQQLQHHAQVLEKFGNKYQQLALINIQAFEQAVEQQKMFQPIYDLDPRNAPRLQQAYNAQADVIFNKIKASMTPKEANPNLPQAKVDHWVQPTGMALQNKIDLGEDTTSAAVAHYDKPITDKPVKRIFSFSNLTDKAVTCPGCSLLSKGWEAPSIGSWTPQKITCRYCGEEHGKKKQ